MTISRYVRGLFFLFILSCSATFAQTEKTDSLLSTEYFPKVSDSLIISKNGFYLQKVSDTRTNKTNNGYIERGLSKRRLVFQDSLASYISSFIYPTKPNPLLVPLSIQVEKLRIFSSSDGKTDNAQIYVKLNVYDELAHEKLKTFERTLNYRKKVDTSFLGKVVFDAFRIALTGLTPKTILRSAPISSTSDSASTEVLVLKEESQERNVHKIAFSPSPFEWASSEYYLADVKDVRNDQRNVGMVRKGFFSQKYEAEVDSGLEVYLKKSIHSLQDSSKKGLTLYVNSFQIKEDASAYGEENNLFFTGILAYDSAGTTIQMYQHIVEFDTVSDKDITSKWPSLIRKAISIYFQPFEGKKARKLLMQQSTGANSYFLANEIRAEKYGYRDLHFHQNKELKGLKDFSPIFKMDADSVNNTFASAKSLCYMGRISMAVGGTLLAWSGLDFLLSEEQSLSKWYNGGEETSTVMKFVDKKMVIKVGTAHLIGGIICNIIGKVVLDKAIRMHNKSLAERVSFNLSPDIYNNGLNFHVNLLLGFAY